MRHSYIFIFLCCWQIKSIISEVDEKERDKKEINDIFIRMRRAYESGDHNNIKPKTWGVIAKNNDAKVWNELVVPFIYNIDSNPYNKQDPRPLINEINPSLENNDISIEMPNKFGSSSMKTPKNFDIFDEYDTDEVEVPDSLLDVMKNEKFWTWLQSWTATYMELLLERIHESVVNEVDKQLKIRLTNTTETVDKPLTITYEESEDIENKNNDYDDGDNTNTDDDDDDDDDDYTYYNDEYPEENDEEQEQKPEENDEEQEQKPEKKEEPVDLNENTLDEIYPIIDERVKEETEEVRAKRNDVQVKSKQIYGNSLNTDKVTNVFIFLQKPEDIFNVIGPLIGDPDIINDEDKNKSDENELNEMTTNEVTEEKVTEEKVTEEKVAENETKEIDTVTEEVIQNVTEDFSQTDAEPVQELPEQIESNEK